MAKAPESWDVVDYGNGIYYFPCILSSFGNTLSDFLAKHRELEIVTMASNNTSSKGEIDMKKVLPPSRGCLVPINIFLIGGRRLYLYSHPGQSLDHSYSLVWEPEEVPIQNSCSYLEVFNILAQELKRVAEKTEIDVQPKHIVSAKKKPKPPPGWRGGPWGRDYKDVEIKPKGIKGIKDPSPRKPIRPIALGDSWDQDQEERGKF